MIPAEANTIGPEGSCRYLVVEARPNDIVSTDQDAYIIEDIKGIRLPWKETSVMVCWIGLLLGMWADTIRRDGKSQGDRGRLVIFIQ